MSPEQRSQRKERSETLRKQRRALCIAFLRGEKLDIKNVGYASWWKLQAAVVIDSSIRRAPVFVATRERDDIVLFPPYSSDTRLLGNMLCEVLGVPERFHIKNKRTMFGDERVRGKLIKIAGPLGVMATLAVIDDLP